MSFSREGGSNYKVGYLDALNCQSALRKWLTDNNYMQPGSTKGKPFTHAFLNGGTALIPDDKHEIFLKLYAEDIDNNVPWSIHENATRFSRLYFDFDISEPNREYGSEIEFETLQRWASLLQTAAFQFFPDAAKTQIGGSVVVLLRPPTFSYKRPVSAPSRIINFGTNGTSIINNVKASDPKVTAMQIALAERIRTGGRSEIPICSASGLPASIIVAASATPQRTSISKQIEHIFDSPPPRSPQQRGYVKTPIDLDVSSVRRCFSDAPHIESMHANDNEETPNPCAAGEVGTVCVRKSGIHFIFPSIVCDLNQMLQIRDYAVRLFKKEFPHSPGAIDWEVIIDPGIYTGNSGLRMPFSFKVETCSACRAGERKRLKCLECANQPRRLVPLSYRPIMFLASNHIVMEEVFNTLVSTTNNVMQRCSLRQPLALKSSFAFRRLPSLGSYEGPSIQYTLAEPVALNSSWTNAKRDSVHFSGNNNTTGEDTAVRKRKSNHDSLALLQPIESGGGVSTAVARRKIMFEYGREEPISLAIEDFLRLHTCRQWRHLSVSKVQTLETRGFGSRNGEKFLTHSVKVCGEGANFCQNVQREHTSSSIYFTITEQGVFQRCFCRKDTLDGRVMGTKCSEFISHAFALDSDVGSNLYQMLFPHRVTSEKPQSVEPYENSNQKKKKCESAASLAAEKIKPKTELSLAAEAQPDQPVKEVTNSDFDKFYADVCGKH